MFRKAADLATAALSLIELAETPDIHKKPELAATLEFAAAVLATHVMDWHYLERGVKETLASGDYEEFKKDYPQWDALRQIANGTKHPVQKYPHVSAAVRREAEWEDDQWWESVPGRSQQFIDVSGKDRGVRTLTWSFCNQYLRSEPNRTP